MLSSFYYGLDVVAAVRNEADDLMVMVMMLIMRRIMRRLLHLAVILMIRLRL